MPPWSQAHPLIVHFPIALLLTAPGIVLLGLLWPSQRRGIHAAALLLLLVGTGMAVLAVATGLAASTMAARSPEVQAALDIHEQLGKRTALLYAGLTLAFLVIQMLPVAREQEKARNRLLALHWVWLILSVGACASLIQTGHMGGHIVHDLGFRTGITGSGQPR